MLHSISAERAMISPSAIITEWKIKNWYEIGLVNACSTDIVVVNIDGMASARIPPITQVGAINASKASRHFSSPLNLATAISTICIEQK